VATWTAIPGLSLTLPLLLLLFPDGRLPSPRWRPAVWLIVAATAAGVVGQALRPGPLDVLPSLPNPLGAEGAAGRALTARLSLFGAVVLPLGLLVGAAALIVRFRRARGEERQQLKWMTGAVALLAVSLAYAYAAAFVLGLGTFVAVIPFGVAVVSIPLAAGMAVLKYRLYAIDPLLDRTLVYGALTAGLALVYAGGLVAGSRLLRSFGGQGVAEILLVVMAVVVAVLFHPARARLRALIGRRFDRQA
jgi:hypothetical protein